MVDDIFDNSRPLGRVEVRTGVGRRRRWSEEQKGRIVAESYRAGAVVGATVREPNWPSISKVPLRSKEIPYAERGRWLRKQLRSGLQALRVRGQMSGATPVDRCATEV